MKRFVLLFVSAAFVLLGAVAQHLAPAVVGDVDGSGAVDGSDINTLINIILGKDNAANYGGRANIDGKSGIDGGDVNALINILLGK